jgi:hypothetical protein
MMGNMKKIRYRLFFVMVIALAASSYTYAITKSGKTEFTQKIEAAAINELHESNTPSLQISIGIGTKIIYEGAFGSADI